MTMEEVLASPRAANQRCEAPLEETELRKIATPIGRYEPSWDLWVGASADVRNDICRMIPTSAGINGVAGDVSLVPLLDFEPLLDARSRAARQDPPGRGVSNGKSGPGWLTLRELGVAI